MWAGYAGNPEDILLLLLSSLLQLYYRLRRGARIKDGGEA